MKGYKYRIKGFSKVALGLMLLAPTPACITAGLAINVPNENNRKEILTEFEASADYQEADAYRKERLQYINDHQYDIAEDSKALADERDFLNSATTNETSFMYSILKQSQFGEAYQIAADKASTGFALALIGVFGGTLLYMGSEVVTGAIFHDAGFGAVAKHLIRGGAIQALGKDPAEINQGRKDDEDDCEED